ncbi:active regulator of SIRT1-like [Calliphora vicina]|uniref:active regulator of SIRT1-like n=1 Tax=Calliphora vicina TaxID=7373 RepID=UPI00325B2190
MSLKLLKQSVDIIEEDLKQTKTKKGKQTSNANNKNYKTQNKTIAVEHFSKKHKKSIQDVKHELKSSNKKTEENIKRLLALSMNTVKAKDAEKIVQRAHKGRYVEKIIPKVKQESIFTEEDFRKFEEEYFKS